jgi:hypothetical protein
MAIQSTEGPMGRPGERDPLASCVAYQPECYTGYWDGCEGDGHYLCEECCHLGMEVPECAAKPPSRRS